MRREAEELATSAARWVDGSFVESKLDPGDVDVVTFVDYDTVNRLAAQTQDLAKVLQSAEAYGAADFASRMGLKSLRGLDEQLRNELKAAEMLEL